MTYEEKLTDVVATLTGSPVLLPAENLMFANMRSEDVTFPLVMVLQTGLGSVTVKTQVIKNGNISLLFAEKVDLDVDYSVKRACWDRMTVLGYEFLVKSGLSGHFFEPTEVTGPEEVFDKFDVNICGVFFNMKLKERSGVNVCTLSNFPPTIITAICSRTALVLRFSKPMNPDETLSNIALWVNDELINVGSSAFVSSTEIRLSSLSNAISHGDVVQVAVTPGLMAVDGSIFKGGVFAVTNQVV